LTKNVTDTYVAKNETIEPAAIGPSKDLYSGANKSGNFKNAAPAITGSARRKAKSDAVACESFLNNPALILTPNLLIPDSRANDCAKPTVIATGIDRCSTICELESSFTCDRLLLRVNLSALKSKSPLIVRNVPAASGLAKTSCNDFSKVNPRTATGIVAKNTLKNIFYNLLFFIF